MTQWLRSITAVFLGVAFTAVGCRHFADPDPFNAIVPRYLGVPWFWTVASGVLEILFGLGLLLPAVRRASARLLVVLVLLMSLANVNMWLNDLPFGSVRLTPTGHALRAGAQVLLLLALSWIGEWIPPRRQREASGM